MDAGVPEDVARRHAFQPILAYGPAAISVARDTGAPIEDVARAFSLIGDAVYLDWLETRVAALRATSRWQRWAIQAAWEDLHLVRRELAERVLAEADGRTVDEGVGTFLADHAEAFDRLVRFMRALALEDATDIAAMTVAVRKVRGLAG
jgi:glutamate dehydrogenase